MKMRVYAGSERFTTRLPDRVTHCSFSFGDFYDPENVSFGPLQAFNEHRLSWGAGYPDHPHSDVELVTWVMHGKLVHTDSLGHQSVLPAGTVQVQSAGTGITHAEFADTSAEPTRFVQSWLTPDERGQVPARFLASGLSAPGLVAVAGEGGQLPIGVAGATLWVGELTPGQAHPVPASPRHHLFVTGGSTMLVVPPSVGPTHGTLVLEAGDAVRLSDADQIEAMTLEAITPSQVLLWSLPA